MADIEINALPASGALDGSEELPADKGAATVKVTTQDIAGLVPTHNPTEPTHDLALAGQTPSKAECDAAMAALGLDYADDHLFFIRDTRGPQFHHSLVVYRANGDTDNTGTAYRFWVTSMDEAA